jgi:hypothetical protein
LIDRALTSVPAHRLDTKSDRKILEEWYTNNRKTRGNVMFLRVLFRDGFLWTWKFLQDISDEIYLVFNSKL